MNIIPLDPIPYWSDYDLISVQLGFDNSVLVLETPQAPKRIKGMFVPRVTKGLTWRIRIYENQSWREIDVYHPSLNFYHAQKIDNDRVLLVAARTTNDLTHNACIYSMNGQLLSSFALDDAIESVNVTSDGFVWVSYFDEGVFSDGKIARFGLVKSDLKGNIHWTAEQFEICDCYAVNTVNSDSCWFYYYDDFDLVHINNDKVSIYHPDIEGAGSFAVLGNYVLMQNGYDYRQEFILFEIRGNKLLKQQTFRFANPERKTFQQAHYHIRENRVLAQTDKGFFYGQIEYQNLFSGMK